MRKGYWKRLIAGTSIIVMVTANMSSDFSAMKFVYADDTEAGEEVSEESADDASTNEIVTDAGEQENTEENGKETAESETDSDTSLATAAISV